ncbi:MAG: PilT protein domain protein [Frankiales bacterium]|nr:PilT protein domain protein [Frankiales bacterium]
MAAGVTFAGYVLAFDVESGGHYAAIVAARTKQGAPISAFDAAIAAICRQNDASLATRNLGDFAHAGLDLIDPWTIGPTA